MSRDAGQESPGFSVPGDSILREARAETIRLGGGLVVKE